MSNDRLSTDDPAFKAFVDIVEALTPYDRRSQLRILSAACSLRGDDGYAILFSRLAEAEPVPAPEGGSPGRRRSQMKRSELLRQQAAVFEMRSAALDEGIKLEAGLRTIVNLLAAAASVVPLLVTWSARGLLLGAGAWLAVRVVGIVLVNRWADRAIQRIKDRYPLLHKGEGPHG